MGVQERLMDSRVWSAVLVRGDPKGALAVFAAEVSPSARRSQGARRRAYATAYLQDAT